MASISNALLLLQGQLHGPLLVPISTTPFLNRSAMETAATLRAWWHACALNAFAAQQQMLPQAAHVNKLGVQSTENAALVCFCRCKADTKFGQFGLRLMVCRDLEVTLSERGGYFVIERVAEVCCKGSLLCAHQVAETGDARTEQVGLTLNSQASAARPLAAGHTFASHMETQLSAYTGRGSGLTALECHQQLLRALDKFTSPCTLQILKAL
jgi:hypothetical protein